MAVVCALGGGVALDGGGLGVGIGGGVAEATRSEPAHTGKNKATHTTNKQNGCARWVVAHLKASQNVGRWHSRCKKRVWVALNGARGADSVAEHPAWILVRPS